MESHAVKQQDRDSLAARRALELDSTGRLAAMAATPRQSGLECEPQCHVAVGKGRQQTLPLRQFAAPKPGRPLNRATTARKNSVIDAGRFAAKSPPLRQSFQCR
jgi:hypothetical protein